MPPELIPHGLVLSFRLRMGRSGPGPTGELLLVVGRTEELLLVFGRDGREKNKSMGAVRDFGEPPASKGPRARERRAFSPDERSCARLEPG